MTELPPLGICVLTYEEVDATVACLASLQAAGLLDAARVVLVDNASSSGARLAVLDWVRGALDPAAEWQHPDAVDLAAFSHGLRLVRAARNGGYAAGNNVGLRLLLASGCRWLLVLNNDIELGDVTAPGLALALATATPDEVLGFRLHDPRLPDSDDVLGGGQVERWRARTRFVTPRRPGTLDFLSGAALLVGADALQRAGLLCEDHFLYWEDTDLCWRLRARGHRLRVLEDLVLVHRTGTSTGSFSGSKSVLVHRESARSCVLFYRRHLPALVPVAVLARCFQAARVALAGNPAAGRAVIGGLLAGLRPARAPAS